MAAQQTGYEAQRRLNQQMMEMMQRMYPNEVFPDVPDPKSRFQVPERAIYYCRLRKKVLQGIFNMVQMVPPPRETEKQLRNLQSKRDVGKDRSGSNDRSETGCNRVVNNNSWGASGLVSFGAQNAVAIFCPKTAQILTTLPGHKASVNCTHWLRSSKFAFKAKDLDRHYLLSGDTDGIIIIWELFTVNNNWRHVRQLPQSHKKGVTCITAYMVSETDALLLQMEL
ncbi:hypothetical protein Bca4012_092024 [Brassica carinata]